jgi:hypothetical protein
MITLIDTGRLSLAIFALELLVAYPLFFQCTTAGPASRS